LKLLVLDLTACQWKSFMFPAS